LKVQQNEKANFTRIGFGIGPSFRESGSKGHLDNKSQNTNREVPSPTILFLKKGGDEIMP
jgi:hypothetical protein